MGLFDYVHFSIMCPVCLADVDDFQTKDADCDGSTIEPDELSCFYTSCGNCGAWIKFERPPPKPTHRDKSLTLEEVLAMEFVLTVAQNYKLVQK